MGRAAGTAVAEIRRALPLRADGSATVLAIGTANPATCIPQDAYPDYCFRVTKSEHHSRELKAKLKRLCDESGTKQRYFHHDEALLAAHPELLSPSLDARLDIARTAVPELAASAARKAIAEWGRAATDITHLVVTTNSGAHVPGADLRLVALLGLRPTVRRTMLHLIGCSGGAAALRLAMDLAESSRGERVLVVCAELTLLLFARPDPGQADRFQTLVNHALFGDGAGAVVVGANPAGAERVLFEHVSAAQTVIPGTEDAIDMSLANGGLALSGKGRCLPVLIGDGVEQCVLNALAPLGVVDGPPDWNDLFWVVHPGTPGILNRIEAVLRLQPGKLAASRRVLRDYGNMWAASVIFVLNEMLKKQRDLATQGEEEGQLEWGVLMAFGPGITFETMVLRVLPGKEEPQAHSWVSVV